MENTFKTFPLVVFKVLEKSQISWKSKTKVSFVSFQIIPRILENASIHCHCFLISSLSILDHLFAIFEGVSILEAFSIVFSPQEKSSK